MPTSGPAAVLGVPYDAASSFRRGPAAAPDQIRKALASSVGNSWSEMLVDISAPDVLIDAGDVRFAGDDVRDAIDSEVTRVLSTGLRPIVLGGDHSITFPVVRAVSRTVERLTILHVDAHADLYDSFEGDRFSHACPFARIMEERLCSRLVQVGIRTLTPHQRDQIKRFDIDTIEMQHFAGGARPATSGPVYLTIDIDGIDPAFAPGVSHREPGGLSVRDVITLIHTIAGPIVGADVVEFNPAQDLGGVTASVAAKITREIAGAILLQR